MLLCLKKTLLCYSVIKTVTMLLCLKKTVTLSKKICCPVFFQKEISWFHLFPLSL